MSCVSKGIESFLFSAFFFTKEKGEEGGKDGKRERKGRKKRERVEIGRRRGKGGRTKKKTKKLFFFHSDHMDL